MTARASHLRTDMRILISLISVAAFAGTASADLTKLDDGAIPSACRTVEHSPAPTLHLKLAQRISIATCTASIRLDAAQHSLKQTTAAIQALGDAVSPSITMLDEVIQQGDPELAIIAERAKGDLYVGLGIRLRNSMRYNPEMIEPAVRPWLAAGDRAFRHAEQLAQAHPELPHDQVVASALQISREMLDDTRTIVGSR